MPRFRFVFVNKGRVVSRMDATCTNVRDAAAKAARLAGDFGVEVWSGERLVCEVSSAEEQATALIPAPRSGSPPT